MSTIIGKVGKNEKFIHDTNIKDDFRINFTMMSLLGLWVPTSYLGTRKGFVYRTYSWFSVVWMVVCPTLSEVIYIIIVFGDIQKMAEGMYFAMSHLAWNLKVYTVIRHRIKIQKIFDTVEAPIFCRVDIESTQNMRTMTRRNHGATVALLSVAAVTCIMFALFPFMDAHGFDLPIHTWYPFDKNKTHWFAIFYVYQVVTTCYVAMSNTVLDTLVSGTIAIACGQLDALCDKLSDKYRRLTAAADNNFSLESYANTEIEKHLSHCVQHHNKIAEFVKESEGMFSSIAFVQFFASCVILCLTAFKLTVVENASEFLGVFLYMVCMLIELVIFSYFGNELIIKSQSLCEAAYRSPWYEMNLQNRKYIFIIMEQAKRPLQVTAVIFTLSLTTFTSVLRSSYSYFAVLQRVNNN